jgi:DNA-binding MarR family transcriptional regulator
MDETRQTPHRNGALLSNEELDQLWAISSNPEDEKTASKRQSTHHLYMEFLQLSSAGSSNRNLPNLKPNEQHLLEQIAVHCDLGNPMSVSQACLMRHFGCVSTVHHQIQKLSAAGLILLSVDQKDRRKKCISLSSNGLRYFEQIEDCLDAALMHQ